MVRGAMPASFGNWTRASKKWRRRWLQQPALQAVVADDLVDFAAPICGEQATLELLEEFGGAHAVLGVGEDEAHILLVSDCPEAPLSQRAVGAVLHGNPGVIDLEPRAAEQAAVNRVGDGAEESCTSADPRGLCCGGAFLPLPLHAGGLAIRRYPKSWCTSKPAPPPVLTAEGVERGHRETSGFSPGDFHTPFDGALLNFLIDEDCDSVMDATAHMPSFLATEGLLDEVDLRAVGGLHGCGLGAFVADLEVALNRPNLPTSSGTDIAH
jgi:hypothetical protein